MKKIILSSLLLVATTVQAEIKLTPLTLAKVGQIKQLDVSENGHLALINQKGELWYGKADNIRQLSNNASPNIAPSLAYGRIALADKEGHFMLWDGQKLYSSKIPMAEQATMQPLALATIGVVKQGANYKLARIELRGNQVEVVATSKEDVLPDARPIQVNLNGHDNQQGHIAVLVEPDKTTYQHAVLGDDIEAKSVLYLERHSLRPLASKLNRPNLVFEANQFSVLNKNGKNRLVSVMSGNGNGGRTVLIGEQNGKLFLEAESQALPSHRWQSPFVFNQQLYTVQMPHLAGRLVSYTQSGNALKEQLITAGMSNHSYGTYETNLVAQTANFAVVPQYGYTQIGILDKAGQLKKLEQTLPSAITKVKSNQQRAYLLLKNGQIWTVEDKK